eukprot:TRINITY_DN93482_c0_g1_i1.p1 TRINITY_DN93482_c0_g1~~TRINITY_DN93482_c0_g1_i1.p1  ORF type:complete len:114 (-),score=2.94 TRINITY_DN93482_c0_g1_i1:10-351(-)
MFHCMSCKYDNSDGLQSHETHLYSCRKRPSSFFICWACFQKSIFYLMVWLTPIYPNFIDRSSSICKHTIWSRCSLFSILAKAILALILDIPAIVPVFSLPCLPLSENRLQHPQ